MVSWSDTKAFALSVSLAFLSAEPRGDVTATSCLGYLSHLLDNSHFATKLALLFPWTRSYQMTRSNLYPDVFNLGGMFLVLSS